MEFNNKVRPRSNAENEKKCNTYESVNALYEGGELSLNAFNKGISSLKSTQGKELKILTPKKLLRRLPVVVAQVQAGNTSENILSEIRHIIYDLYRAKEITKKSM